MSLSEVQSIVSSHFIKIKTSLNKFKIPTIFVELNFSQKISILLTFKTSCGGLKGSQILWHSIKSWVLFPLAYIWVSVWCFDQQSGTEMTVGQTELPLRLMAIPIFALWNCHMRILITLLERSTRSDRKNIGAGREAQLSTASE